MLAQLLCGPLGKCESTGAKLLELVLADAFYLDDLLLVEVSILGFDRSLGLGRCYGSHIGIFF